MNRIVEYLRRNKAHIQGIGACVLLLLVLILLTDMAIMPLVTHHGMEKELPDVTEMPFDQAAELLESKGFTIVRDGEKFDDNYEAGTVVSQNPLPFAMVKKGRRIYVIVSAGEKLVKVPKVTGSSEREALFLLKQAGLTLGEMYYEYDNYYPKDVVCRQSKSEGIEVHEQDTVDVTVSLGSIPENFIVPDVAGRSLKDATRLIRKAGLRVGVITPKLNDSLLPDTVIEQTPIPGEEVTYGAAIDLVVSSLKEKEEEL